MIKDKHLKKKKTFLWGAWEPQSVKDTTLDIGSGHDLRSWDRALRPVACWA